MKSLSEQNFKKINMKNIKMKPPVALFKKKSKEKDKLRNFSFRAIHEIQFQFHET